MQQVWKLDITTNDDGDKSHDITIHASRWSAIEYLSSWCDERNPERAQYDCIDDYFGCSDDSYSIEKVDVIYSDSNNDRMIEAAPAMLEALETMWKFVAVFVEEHTMNGDDAMTDAEQKQWQEAARKVRRAIAKARNI